eukprot:COSAG01_NODE_6375_length_3705_cov_2.301442_3_plen_122_part_00
MHRQVSSCPRPGYGPTGMPPQVYIEGVCACLFTSDAPMKSVGWPTAAGHEFRFYNDNAPSWLHIIDIAAWTHETSQAILRPDWFNRRDHSSYFCGMMAADRLQPSSQRSANTQHHLIVSTG